MNEMIFMVERDIEGGYTAQALGHGIFTEGADMQELKANIKEALRCHFDNEKDIPQVIRLHMVTEEVFSYA